MALHRESSRRFAFRRSRIHFRQRLLIDRPNWLHYISRWSSRASFSHFYSLVQVSTARGNQFSIRSVATVEPRPSMGEVGDEQREWRVASGSIRKIAGRACYRGWTKRGRERAQRGGRLGGEGEGGRVFPREIRFTRQMHWRGHCKRKKTNLEI